MTHCTLRVGVLETIVAHAREVAPVECCGVLLGAPGEVVEVVEAVRARNLADDPNRFLIDPKDHFNARRRGRTLGFEVVGFYHSHPHSMPDPSPTDLANASYPDHLYLIVSLAVDPPAMKLFRLGGDGFEEVST